jgi:membrane peptidoglycan carboxypeptidase
MSDRVPEDQLRLTRRRIRLLKWMLRLVVVSVLAGFVYWELDSSHLQSMLFTRAASGVDHYVGDGPSPHIRFPDSGPYDRRTGYTALPNIVDRLTDEEYRISRQARVSKRFRELVDRGLFAPYNEKQRAGLRITDPYDNTLHKSLYPKRYYESFDQVPELVVDTLLYIENRALLDKDHPRRNPALEPDRFLQALLQVAKAEVTNEGNPSGASTLATQVEKFRHSPDGQTATYDDKLRQMLSASVRSYLDDAETLDDQRRIVLTYLNSVPLAGVEGFGEVFGIGDALYAWYDANFGRVNDLLETASATDTRASTGDLAAQAKAYRQVLSLMVAQRRPSHFLHDGRDQLVELTNFYLRHLADRGIISERFRDLALDQSSPMNGRALATHTEPFRKRKLTYSLRTDLLARTGRDSLYQLDRLDLQVSTTLDYDVQRSVEQTLHRMRDREFIERKELDQWRLLDDDDPSEVVYSFTLYEKTPEANLLRVQADTFDGPFNVNEGVKLNLGSTAKLRTLASYLQIVADLHARYTDMSDDELEDLEIDWRDRLSRWSRQYVRDNPGARLDQMLRAAMDRRYSAEPDSFFTGGGVQSFSNFSYKYNDEWPTIRMALENSINLVFVRLMRDIVRYHMFRLPDSDPDILMRPDHPKRRDYLEQFADYEGKKFLREFWNKYEGTSTSEALIEMKDGRTFTADRLSVAYRTIYPDADIYTFNDLLKQHFDEQFGWSYVEKLYHDYDPSELSINDLGYLANMNPLELWLLRYRRRNPEADYHQMLRASGDARQKAYEWLFDTDRKEAQDRRIRIILERNAFERLHEQWKSLGYPFDELVPSYATALGSSADRPAALSKLMGIIVNDGLRKPTNRFESLHFADGTPYETKLERTPEEPERVMRREVADTLRRATLRVVEDGTASRLNQYPIKVDGERWTVGGKTGTGDNRRKVHNRHGTLIKSIPQNRTGTFVFHIDDRFFGSITAYVPGKQSGDYEFTSGLAVSVLGILAPKLRPLWWRDDRQADEPARQKPQHFVSTSPTPKKPENSSR